MFCDPDSAEAMRYQFIIDYLSEGAVFVDSDTETAEY
jgi:hypothetical protein